MFVLIVACCGLASPSSYAQGDSLQLTGREETDLKRLLERESAAVNSDWPGSIGVFGSSTRIKISGFAEINAIHDNHAIGTPTAFVTSAIVTEDGTPAEGSNGLTSFSVQVSRLAVETRTPIGRQLLTTFISTDFFGDDSTADPDFRLRQAYGEVSDILFGGDLRFGQTWTAFTYLPSQPNTLDFEGPPADVDLRRPALRWTKGLVPCLKLKLALEAPDSQELSGADTVSEWPDAVAALAWATDRAHLQGAIVSRDLRGSGNDENTVSATGWGAAISGRIHMPWARNQDFLTFSYTRGDGIGGLLNDAPPDAIYDADSNSLHDLPARGAVFGFQHWWNQDFYSVVTYSEVKVDNLEIQASGAYRKGEYNSANLVWTPIPNLLFGFEALYGSRTDKNGARGSVTRFQFTSRLTF